MSIDSVNKSMLRIAYLLTALDGETTPDEISAFKQVAASFEEYKAGSPEINEFLEEIIDEGNKLTSLKKLYSDEELIKTFMVKVKDDILAVYYDACLYNESAIIARKAFAMWVGICIADSDYSSIERKAITKMQEIINLNTVLLEYKLENWEESDKKLEEFKEEMLHSWGFEESKKEAISDSFLEEIEEHCRTLVELQIQIDKLPDDNARKIALKGSYDSIVNMLKEMITEED